jgi:hypothetical protein
MPPSSIAARAWRPMPDAGGEQPHRFLDDLPGIGQRLDERGCNWSVARDGFGFLECALLAGSILGQ